MTPKPPAPAPKPPAPKPAGPSLIYPVVGPSQLTDSYGDARGQGSHAGVDIMAPRKALAVAVEPGKVKFWTTSARAGCMLYLYGDSGTTYLYIHLNNDLTAGNDNRGKCVAGTAFAKGLRSGVRVAAGEPIGYVGDSGDANGISPHLHFELHPKGKSDVDPYPALRKSRKLLFAAKPGAMVSLSLSGTLVSLADGKLSLQVTSLSVSTGLRVENVGRTVVLDLPPWATIQSPISSASRLLKGRRMKVSTEVFATTLAAQLGKPRALSIALVTVGA